MGRAVCLPAEEYDFVWGRKGCGHGVKAALPRRWDMDDTTDMHQTLSAGATATAFFGGDKAGGNIMMHNRLAWPWDRVSIGLKKVFALWLESCDIHSHNRGRVDLTPAERHTSRHFATANCSREQEVQALSLRLYEAIVTRSWNRSITTVKPYL